MPPFELALPVRFSDLDGMGHVNNAVFLTYLEEARTRFFVERMGPVGASPLGFILARTEIDFKTPLGLGDQVTIRMWAGEPGRSSFPLHYEVWSREHDAVAAEAVSVQVWYDYGAGEGRPLPDEVRALLRGLSPD